MYKTYIRSLFTLLIMIMFALAIPALASAASIGNPDILGGLGEVSLGVEYDDSSTDLQLKNGRQTLSWPGGSYSESFPGEGTNVTDMKLNTRSKFLVGTVGVHKKVDIFAGIGDSGARINYTLNYPGGHDNGEVADNSNFAWKAGVRAQLAEISGVKIGAMGQYSAYDMDGTYKFNGSDLVSMFTPSTSYSTKTEVREWQAALTASTHVWRLSPYAGVTYNKVTVENKTTVHIPVIEDESYSLQIEANAEQEHTTGVVVGTGVEITDHLNANIEGRFANTDAVTASLSYAF